MKELGQKERSIILKALGLLEQDIEERLEILRNPEPYHITKTELELKEVQSVIETLKSEGEVSL